MSSLRLVACGRSAAESRCAFEDKLMSRFGSCGGMTETSPLATMAWPPPGTRTMALGVSASLRAVTGVRGNWIVDDDGSA